MNYRENAPWLDEPKKHADKNYLVSVTMSISIPALVECDEEHFDNSGRQMNEAVPYIENKLFYTLYALQKQGWHIDEKEIIVDPEQPEKVVYEHVDTIDEAEDPEEIMTKDLAEMELNMFDDDIDDSEFFYVEGDVDDDTSE